MSFLVWTADLDTTIEVVDTQHHSIIDCINRLHEAAEAGNDRESCLAIIDDLVQVTTNHFRDEERLMQDSNYEYFDIHKGVHDRFVANVTDLRQRFAMGLDTAEPILDLMNTWLYSHISNNDRGYITSVKAHQAH